MTTYSFDFLKYRYVCFAFSLAICATFAGLYMYKVSTQGHAFNYSVDFTGGTQLLFKFSEPISTEKVKSILEDKGWSGPVLREFEHNEILVRVKEYSNDAKGLGERMKNAIQEAAPQNKVEILQTDSVGGGVSETLRLKSLYTVLMALFIMLLYIGIRFWSFSFAVGAVVALLHDAIVILTCFLLLDKEISINVIGAILLILGYSVNDTIVIFSRIRENIKLYKDRSMYDIVNISLNQTLRRTILTSVATLLVVVSLIIFGGEALRDLSLALLIGIIFGTYSSIYIASPVMLLLYRKKS